MSIKSTLHLITSEVGHIKESKGRIKLYSEGLNELNPFSIGDKLIGNGWTHEGKPFLVDKLYVENSLNKDMDFDQNSDPAYFVARGFVINKDGKMSTYRTSYSAKITDYIPKN